MKTGWRWKVTIVAAALWGSSASGLQAGQSGMQSAPRPVPEIPSAAPDHRDPSPTRMEEQAARTRNDERQKRIVADTAKLYELAGQLKDDVARTDKNTLSVDVVKKAEEIEKLAHTVKDRMRG